MKPNAIYVIFGGIFSFVLANYGIISLKKNPDMSLFGIMSIILSFVIVYFLSYISKIGENEEKIEEINKEMIIIKKNNEVNEKLLNTLKDIILLRGIKK